MLQYNTTDHARTRMSQRAIRNEDIELVMRCGTKIAPDAYFMKDRDVRREIDDLKRRFRQIERSLKGGKQRFERALKRRIQRLERLRGLQVVAVGGVVLTSYWPSLAYQKRARRRKRVARHDRR